MAWMRQSEPETTETPQTNSSRSMASTPAATATATAPAQRPAASQSVATVGQSVRINGELTAKEDLTIEGRVEGQITLADHNLTIGANGRISATIHAKVVEVFGEVVGDITALDKVTIAPSGSVDGDITAPRISIADGARFKGKIDMEGAGSPSGSKPSGMHSSSMQPAKVTV